MMQVRDLWFVLEGMTYLVCLIGLVYTNHLQWINASGKGLEPLK